jgi:hypothetical protein
MNREYDLRRRAEDRSEDEKWRRLQAERELDRSNYYHRSCLPLGYGY